MPKSQIIIFSVAVTLLAVIIYFMFSFSNRSKVLGMNVSDYFTNAKVQELAKAVASGDTNKVNKLVTSGVNPNTIGKDGITLLYWAIGAKSKEGLEALLKNGANPNTETAMQGNDGAYTESIMAFATAIPDTDYLRILLDNKGNANAKNHLGEPILFEVSRDDGVMTDKFDLLISKGADINATDESGDSYVMHEAQTNGFSEINRVIEKYGDKLNLNQKNDLGSTFASIVQGSAVSSTDGKKARDRVEQWLRSRGVKIARISYQQAKDIAIQTAEQDSGQKGIYSGSPSLMPDGSWVAIITPDSNHLMDPSYTVDIDSNSGAILKTKKKLSSYSDK